MGQCLPGMCLAQSFILNSAKIVKLNFTTMSGVTPRLRRVLLLQRI